MLSGNEIIAKCPRYFCVDLTQGNEFQEFIF